MKTFMIPERHPCLDGHFPTQAVVPGVVIMMQVLRAYRAHVGGALYRCVGFPFVKFLHPLLPNQIATICLNTHSEGCTFTVHRHDILLVKGALRNASQ